LSSTYSLGHQSKAAAAATLSIKILQYQDFMMMLSGVRWRNTIGDAFYRTLIL